MDQKSPWSFTPAMPASPWAKPPEPVWRPDFADDESRKQAYGIELAKEPDTFKAALATFNDDQPGALWASANWKNDPIVIASRDAYAKTLKVLEKPLDKTELLAKVLELVDAKDIHGRPLVEAKERINALKLYSEIAGFTGKIDINASTNNITNNTNNLMKITLVKAEPKDQPKVIEAQTIESEISNDETSPIKLKLVGGVR